MRDTCLFRSLALFLGALAFGLGACASVEQQYDEWFGVDRTVVETFDADQVTGRTDEALVARYSSGRKVNKTALGDGGVWVEVREVRNDQPKLLVDLDVRITNRFEDRIRFDVKDVVLTVDGEPYHATSGDWYKESTLDTRGMNHREAKFQFPVGTLVMGGTYELAIRNVRLVDGPDEIPVGDVKFPLDVIGKRAPEDDAASG